MFSTATKIPKSNFPVFSCQRNYAGHSHWHNIKFKKERSDLIKMQAYCKLAASIRNSVRIGGANPLENPLLAQYLETAKKTAFPKEKVALAIKSGLGEGVEGGDSMVFECRGPEAIMMVFTMTDNRARTTMHVKTILSKNSDDYSVGAPGCASFMFTKEGVLQIKTDKSYDEIMDAMLMSSVEDYDVKPDASGKGNEINLIVDPNALKTVKNELAELGLTNITKAEVKYKPRSGYVAVSEPHVFEKLLELLGEDQDVIDVVHNVDLDLSWKKFEEENKE